MAGGLIAGGLVVGGLVTQSNYQGTGGLMAGGLIAGGLVVGGLVTQSNYQGTGGLMAGGLMAWAVSETGPCRYQEFLRRARTEAFSDLASLHAFYKAGQDYLGRNVVVFVGSKFPAPNYDLSRVSRSEVKGQILSLSTPSQQAMAYFIQVMESIVHRDYIIVYFNSGCQSERLPDSNFFRDLYNMADPK